MENKFEHQQRVAIHAIQDAMGAVNQLMILNDFNNYKNYDVHWSFEELARIKRRLLQLDTTMHTIIDKETGGFIGFNEDRLPVQIVADVERSIILYGKQLASSFCERYCLDEEDYEIKVIS